MNICSRNNMNIFLSLELCDCNILNVHVKEIYKRKKAVADFLYFHKNLKSDFMMLRKELQLLHVF